MKDYYSTLNIAKSATAAEIKKAYFSLVRKYPPERHPAEFMQIREAYEVLIDESTRRQYDSVEVMPEVVRLYFREGQAALQSGDTERAIQLLEKVVKAYPRFSVVSSLLGEAYLKNENSGKAIRVFEELAARERNNAGFARQLAQAYAMRGWHRKAIDGFQRALSLDEDNISLWLGLINCYLAVKDFDGARETVLKGLEVSSQKGWDNLELYYYAVQIDIFSGDHDAMQYHLAEMKNKALAKEEEKAHVAWFLARLARRIQNIGLHEESAATIETALALQPEDKEIQEIKKELDAYHSIIRQIKELEADPSFDAVLTEMLEAELDFCDNRYCLDCQTTQFFMEMHIIIAMSSYRRHILRLKNSYPELYNLKKEFFNNVLNPKKEDYLLDLYKRKYDKFKKLCPGRFEPPEEDDEEYYPAEPYRRAEPKTGRNDPCPCGSGKKYKKCCGA
jgi:tetratricopeptide (TPR) repeat protein